MPQTDVNDRTMVFTVSANNFLARSKVLLDSAAAHCPGCRTHIVLADRFSPAGDYSAIAPHEITEARGMGFAEFDGMTERYDIYELNCALKSFGFVYLFKRYPDVERLIFFDSDILVTGSLEPIVRALDGASAVLTPHLTVPIEPDGLTPDEATFNKLGTYNLGFIAIRRCDAGLALAEWWRRRMAVNCFDDADGGVFLDQLPMNNAPLFFDDIAVCRHQGMNVARWNLHERTITREDGRYVVNGSVPLVFFHFSSFGRYDHISGETEYTRSRIERGTDTYRLFEEYAAMIAAAGHERWQSIASAYRGRKQKGAITA